MGNHVEVVVKRGVMGNEDRLHFPAMAQQGVEPDCRPKRDVKHLP